jgi:hypothetical protein
VPGPVHRLFYPTIKGKRQDAAIPRATPLIAADKVVNGEGVTLEFFQRRRAFTPLELRGMARWLFSLAHEADALASQGLISEQAGYDVVEGKVVSSKGR